MHVRARGGCPAPLEACCGDKQAGSDRGKIKGPTVMGIYLLVLSYVCIVVVIVLMTGRPAVCPFCLAIEPYEGNNYYHCNRCGRNWAKEE